MPRYSKLTDDLTAQLAKVPAGDEQAPEGRPCDVVMKDGRRVPRVYVAEERRYYRAWAVWPEDDRGKRSVRIDDVAQINDSEHRLPPQLAAKLYAAGETGMGYCVFTVVLDDGSRIPFVTGNAVDFIDYPPGKGQQNVVDVLPHVGRDDSKLRKGPEYSWCLYSE